MLANIAYELPSSMHLPSSQKETSPVSLDPKLCPKHIAFIPDGNRRWAHKQSQSSVWGYKKGVENIISLVDSARKLPIDTLTFYLFSTENWKRSPMETKALLSMIKPYLLKQTETMVQSGIQLHTIGDLSCFSKDVVQVIEDTKKATKHCTEIQLVLALNYGGRDEMRRALQKMVADCEAGALKKEQITEQTISSYLDTAPWRDPDLLIRTSGEMRLSNFLLWQLSYTEFFLSKEFWPAFTKEHLMEALVHYQERNRRLGGA